MSGTTDVAFRSWGSSISTALAAVGLVQTSDTGQINWTTVSKPSGATTTAGYEIWRFNDAAQSTTPIFLKLSYGTGSAGNTTTRLLVEIGSASNGSGTLSGLGSGTTYTLWTSSSAADTGSYACHMSSDGSGLAFVHAVTASSSSQQAMVILDRFRDASGAANTDGFALMYRSTATSLANYLFDAVATDLPMASRVYSVGKGGALMPALGVSTSLSSSGGDIYVSPFYALVPYGNGLQFLKMAVCYSTYDYGYGTNQSMTSLGATRTYKMLGAYGAYCDARAQQYASAGIWWSD